MTEPTDTQKMLDRQDSIGWASLMLESEFIVLDTETSDWVEKGGEVIQLGLIDKRGNVLLNTLLKPQGLISEGASSTHGIYEEDVVLAGSFVSVYPYLQEVLTGKPVLAYNASFDQRALDTTCQRYGLPTIECQWHDVMEHYSAFSGDWNRTKGNYRWWKLTEANLHCGLPVVDAHDATADVKMTLNLIQHMAGVEAVDTAKEYDVIIFDIDGTLADRDTSEVYDHVKTWFENNSDQHKIYLATNQGGVGLRYWMVDAGFGDPTEYPTEDMVQKHIELVNSQLHGGPYPCRVCYAYLSKKGNASPTPLHGRNTKEWSLDWRKPEPGMLLDIILDAGVKRSEVLFVGDSSTDKEAAQRAGIDFMLPSEFFGG